MIQAEVRNDIVNTERETVLFVCVYNSVRSQMAEALLRHKAPDRFMAYSAGFDPTDIHPMARQVLEEIGVSMEGQYAKGLDEAPVDMGIHYVVAVSDEAYAKCVSGLLGDAERLCWPFPDPLVKGGSEEESLRAFRSVRDAIAGTIDFWLES